jgi:hypothetical protein
VAHVALLGEGDGIEDLGQVQAEHFLTSRAGRPVLDGLVLLSIAHDLCGDAALFRQLCIFIFQKICRVHQDGMLSKCQDGRVSGPGRAICQVHRAGQAIQRNETSSGRRPRYLTRTAGAPKPCHAVCELHTVRHRRIGTGISEASRRVPVFSFAAQGGKRASSYFRQRNWVQARKAQIRFPAG